MTTLDYQIKHSARSRSLKISIDQAGKVLVSAPKLCPDFFIKKFVKDQEPWIQKQRQKVLKNQTQLNENEVFIFGQCYQIETTESDDYQLGVNLLANKKLLIRQLKPASYKTALERFLKNTASKYLAQKTKLLAEKMNIDYQRISIRQQATRWGSCSSRGNLNFNWRLVHYSPAIINYVIIHELAHRRELNHSKKFWNLVAQYDRDFKKHRTALKKRLYN